MRFCLGHAIRMIAIRVDSNSYRSQIASLCQLVSHACMSIAERIKAAMKARSIGYNELDRLMGKTSGNTSGLIGRKSRPRADVAVAMANALGVRLEYLLSGEEPMIDTSKPDMMCGRRAGSRRRSRSVASHVNTRAVPCPSRDIVVAMARAQEYADAGSRGITEGAIAALLAERRDDGDPGVHYWHEQMKKYVEMSRELHSTINGTGK